jgi:triosephosphate isomerase
MHLFIRDCWRKMAGESADRLSILYGGSVKSSNAESLLRMADVDGLLVGGASLLAEEFSPINTVVSQVCSS